MRRSCVPFWGAAIPFFVQAQRAANPARADYGGAARSTTTLRRQSRRSQQFRQRQDGEAATAPARPSTEPSEQPTESATHTGCRAGAQQQERRRYDAENELTQRAANPARADNGARRDQQQTEIATKAGMLVCKHRIQRNTPIVWGAEKKKGGVGNTHTRFITIPLRTSTVWYMYVVFIVGAVIEPVLYTVLFVCVWVPSLPSRLAQDN